MKSSLFRNQVQKEGETKTLTCQLSCIQKMTSMCTVNNFEVDCVYTAFSIMIVILGIALNL